MKSGIHPNYVTTQVTCTCGSTFTTRSNAEFLMQVQKTTPTPGRGRDDD